MPVHFSAESSGSGSIEVPINSRFASVSSRDIYYNLNPKLLVTNAYCLVGNGLQKYDGTTWIDYGMVVKGDRGFDGVNGKDGINGKDGKDGINGVSGIDGVDGKDGTLENAEHAMLLNRDTPNSHPISAITNLSDIVMQSYVEWINGKFEFILIPPSFDESGLIRYPVTFLSSNDTENPVIHVGDKDYPLFIANTPLPMHGVALQEQCFLSFRPNACYVSGIDLLRASISTGLAGISDSEYMTPLVTKNVISQIVARATAETYTSSRAYVDSLIKDYETVNLYLNPNGIMNTTVPIGTGTVIEKLLNTNEQLIASFSYVIPTDGSIIDTNLYILSLFFNSISTNRTTYIRAEYTVNDEKVFDTLSALNNTRPEFELYRQVLSSSDYDIIYSSGDIAKLSIYGKVDTGSDRIELVLGKQYSASALYRNAISDEKSYDEISANRITTYQSPGGASIGRMTQEQFNSEVGRVVGDLYVRLSLLENRS